MSCDVNLTNPIMHETLEIDYKHSIHGGTYQIGASKYIWLNVAYNYAEIYARNDVFGLNGVRILNGMTGAESIPILQKAIDSLKKEVHRDYWKTTDGDARLALCNVLQMAKVHPDCVWKIF